MDLFSSNGECAIPGGLLPSPSSNLFERSIGALVSTLKNNICNPIPDQNYDMVSQQPQTQISSLTNASIQSSIPTSQNIALTNQNQFNQNIISIPTKNQPPPMIQTPLNNNNNNTPYFQNNIIISSLNSQQLPPQSKSQSQSQPQPQPQPQPQIQSQSQSFAQNISTPYYTTSNLNPTPSSQNIIQQNIPYSVTPQNQTSNPTLPIINSNNNNETEIPNQQLNSISSIQQQSFKPALDFIVGSFMDSIDSINEKLESKNIFPLETIPTSNSKEASKIDYNSNMLILFPPNQDTQIVTVNQLQLQNTQNKTIPYSVPTIQQTILPPNQNQPSVNKTTTIIMGPPPIPKKKLHKQGDKTINGGNDNTKNSINPQPESNTISLNPINTLQNIHSSPALSTNKDHISTIVSSNKLQPSLVSNDNPIYPSPMIQTLNITPSPIMQSNQLESSPLIPNTIIQTPQSNTSQSQIIQSQPYSQNISNLSYSQNLSNTPQQQQQPQQPQQINTCITTISNTSQLINKTQPVIVNGQQIINTSSSQVFHESTNSTFNQIQQPQQPQSQLPQLQQLQSNQSQPVYNIFNNQISSMPQNQSQTQNLQPTLIKQQQQQTIVNINTITNNNIINSNNSISSSSSNNNNILQTKLNKTFITPLQQNIQKTSSITNNGTIIHPQHQQQQQQQQIFTSQTQFITQTPIINNSQQQIINQNQIINSSSFIPQNQTLTNHQPEIVTPNQSININQQYFIQSSNEQPKQQYIQQNNIIQSSTNVMPHQTVQPQPYYSVVDTNYSQQKMNIAKSQEVNYYISPAPSQSVILSNESSTNTNLSSNEIMTPESLSSSSISNQNSSIPPMNMSGVFSSSSSSFLVNSNSSNAYTQLPGPVPSRSSTLTNYFSNQGSSMNNNTLVMPGNITTPNNVINTTPITNNMASMTNSIITGKAPIKPKSYRAKSSTDKRKPFHCDLCPQTFSRSHGKIFNIIIL